MISIPSFVTGLLYTHIPYIPFVECQYRQGPIWNRIALHAPALPPCTCLLAYISGVYLALAPQQPRRSLIITSNPHRQPTPQLLTTHTGGSPQLEKPGSLGLIQAATTRAVPLGYELALHAILELSGAAESAEDNVGNPSPRIGFGMSSWRHTNTTNSAPQTKRGQANSHRHQIAVAIQGYPRSFRNINASC